MSRIGKKAINIPEKVEIKLSDDVISVTGPKGTLTQDLHPKVYIENKDGLLEVTVKEPEIKEVRALWGLYRSLIANMVDGVTQGFEKKLEINGVGYRAQVSGDTVVLNVGFSHPVELPIPKNIDVNVEKSIITIAGIDKQVVGEFAAQIRAQRPPEPYKGKGIRYSDEVVRRKAGKAAKAVGS